MGPGKRAIFEGYGAVSDAWIERGEAISSPSMFAPVIDLLPSEPVRAIDIGAGSGRDAAWLAGLGHRVVAVEPVDRLRKAGMSRHSAETIDWRSGSLPDLGAIAERNAFDLVLVIGVWQHLEAPDQAQAMRRLGAEVILRGADLDAAKAGALSFAARSRAARFASIRLPVMSDAQRTVVEAAFAQAGMPYVWGGDWPTSASPWGAQAQGGFDCSGLVWMAFKGAPSSAALGAGTDLRGRTADAMAFETPSQRVALSVLAPGDLVFFGDAGLRTRRGAVSHVGIALGNGWMVHSSGSRAGVAISPLDSYWASGQARARRPGVFGAPPALTSAEKRGLAR